MLVPGVCLGSHPPPPQAPPPHSRPPPSPEWPASPAPCLQGCGPMSVNDCITCNALVHKACSCHNTQCLTSCTRAYGEHGMRAKQATHRRKKHQALSCKAHTAPMCMQLFDSAGTPTYTLPSVGLVHDQHGHIAAHCLPLVHVLLAHHTPKRPASNITQPQGSSSAWPAQLSSQSNALSNATTVCGLPKVWKAG